MVAALDPTLGTMMESDEDSKVEVEPGADTELYVNDSSDPNATLEGQHAEVTTQSVRRMLASLRGMWRNHSPTSPMCLCDELTPGGMTVSQFCFFLLLSQRNRRGVRTR